MLGLDSNEVCSMFDDPKCWGPLKTADDVYNYLKSNFIRHYASGSSPFPIHGHVRNVNGEKRQGMEKIMLLNFILQNDLFHN